MNGGMYDRLVADTSNHACISMRVLFSKKSMCVPARVHACFMYTPTILLQKFIKKPFSCKKFKDIGDDCACEMVGAASRFE